MLFLTSNQQCQNTEGTIADKPARRAASRQTNKVDAQCDKLAAELKPWFHVKIKLFKEF